MTDRIKIKRSRMSVAAAVLLILAVPSAVFAATAYFQKTVKQEADVITFHVAQKYQTSIYIFLFNDTEGYVPEIIAGYTLDREEQYQPDRIHDSQRDQRTIGWLHPAGLKCVMILKNSQLQKGIGCFFQ